MEKRPLIAAKHLGRIEENVTKNLLGPMMTWTRWPKGVCTGYFVWRFETQVTMNSIFCKIMFKEQTLCTTRQLLEG
jgi:hypothetical protein